MFLTRRQGRTASPRRERNESSILAGFSAISRSTILFPGVECRPVGFPGWPSSAAAQVLSLFL